MTELPNNLKDLPMTTTTKPFTINLEAIDIHRSLTGMYTARYRHPHQPTRIGIANWVVWQGASADNAKYGLMRALEGLGGVLPVGVTV